MRETARRLYEAAGKSGCLKVSGFSGSDKLNFAAVGIGVSVKLQGGMISNDTALPKLRCCCKAIDRPRLSVAMFRHRREQPPCQAADISRAGVLGEHGGDNLVVGFASDGGGIFHPVEDRVGTEERERQGARHGDFQFRGEAIDKIWLSMVLWKSSFIKIL